MSKVAVVGSINMDLVVRAPRFALAGETILGHTFNTIPGGKGANQAVAARRQGADVCMIGRVGSDAFGEIMSRNLEREGINTERLLGEKGESSGVALITVDDNGENTIIVVQGANGRLAVADIEAARKLIAEADVLLMQLEIPLPVVESAAQAAREGGVTVILNAAPARPLSPQLLSLVDYLVVNETEVLLLARDTSVANSTISPEEAARALQRIGARNVVITLGEQGALLLSVNGSSVSVPAFRVLTVDTTAAGDAFVGAFAVRLAAGVEPGEALRWANAAGALTVIREGAQPSLPTFAEVEQFLREKPSI
jgi:ribokinase